jgi:hypothetical protein
MELYTGFMVKIPHFSFWRAAQCLKETFLSLDANGPLTTVGIARYRHFCNSDRNERQRLVLGSF